MAVPLAKGASGTVTIVLPRPATAVTAAWLDPRGTVVEDDLDVMLADHDPIEIGEVIENNVFEAEDTTDATPDAVLWWDAGGRAVGARVRVSEVTSTTVTLESAPPGAPAAGDLLHACTAEVAVPSTLVAELGLNYRIEWEATLSDGTTHRDRTMVHVVQTPFRLLLDAGEVRRYVDAQHASLDRDAGWYREVARRTADRVERALVSSGRLPHLVGDRDLFADAVTASLRITLAYEGLIPGGHDLRDFVELQEAALNGYVQAAIASSWVDRAQSGDTTDPDAVRPRRSVSLRRVS